MQLVRRNRRASSITRAGNVPLSLSSTKPSGAIGAAAAASATNTSSLATAGENPASTSSDGRVRRLTVADMIESVKSLLLVSPAYPSGVGGRMAIDRSRPAAGSHPSTSGCDTAGNKRKRYRMVFNDDTDKRHSASAEVEPTSSAAGQVRARTGLPVGLEAVPDEKDPTLLCVRELGPTGTGSGGGDGSDGGAGRVVARIKARPTVPGGRENIYSVVLAIEADGEGDGANGELMAVRVSTHPTRLAAPREVQAVLLLPRDGEGVGRGSQAQGPSGWVGVSCTCLLLSSPSALNVRERVPLMGFTELFKRFLSKWMAKWPAL